MGNWKFFWRYFDTGEYVSQICGKTMGEVKKHIYSWVASRLPLSLSVYLIMYAVVSLCLFCKRNAE